MTVPCRLYFTITKLTMQFLNSVLFRVLNDLICGVFIEHAFIINRLDRSCKVVITLVMGKCRNIHEYTGVPGGKVNILGGHSIGHSKQKTLYEHVSYSERFPR
jgi:hypothetical protein